MTARILVVDDDERNRRLLEAVLGPAGYDVIEADGGELALEIIARDPVDMVLLDMMMPGLDGVETCRRIRQNLGERFLPVVFVTAMADRQTRVRGKQAGADDFLTKPIDEIELMARVENLLAAKAYHDQREVNVRWLQEELEQRQALLLRTERLASLGTLAGGVGHELNNIATVFVSAFALVREAAAAGEPPDAEDLAALARVGDHLKQHASQLLSLARPGPDHAARLDLREVVTGTLSMLRLMGRIKYVEVEPVLPAAPMPVTVNRTRIEQVLVNLICNAADALGEVPGGPKRIRVTVEASAGDGRVTCHVADTGPGIPGDRLDAIFQPYFTTKPPDRGTGLGLTVAKQIVKSYGGTIRVVSRVGEGTTVTFDLPAAEPEDA
jgi:signal transduction histidine kinase